MLFLFCSRWLVCWHPLIRSFYDFIDEFHFILSILMRRTVALAVDVYQ